MVKLVLASSSPFRRQILAQAGYEFDVMVPLADESAIADLPPSELARQRALFKGQDVAKRCRPGTLVIGADQVLGFMGKAFGKAYTEDEAFMRLSEFSGKVHTLHSAICLIHVQAGVTEIIHSTVVDVTMAMRELSSAEIQKYVATGEWKGCAGCYRFEAEGRHLFSNVDGGEDAIVGLPLAPIAEAYRGLSQVR